MKSFLLSLLALASMTLANAQEGTWSHVWNTSRSDGGEGFYHLTSNDDTIQVATLNNLEWTLVSESSVTAFTGSAGQYIGSAKSPATHARLSTSGVQGKILSVSVEAKHKDGSDVTVSVSVADDIYLCGGEAQAATTTDFTVYTFTPTADAAEGTILIRLDQESETKGPIYLKSLSITYDGVGVVPPVVDPIDPELSYSVTEVTVEAGDDAFGPALYNPYNVSPITYKADNQQVAVIGSNGNIFTIAPGTTTVTATFAGNEQYLSATASYTLNVIAKPVIAAPTADIMGGTFDAPVTVTITSNDEHCKALWYSTTAADSAALTDDPTIVAGTEAKVLIDRTCTLRCVAVDYNNIGQCLTLDFVINTPLQAGISAQEAAVTYYQMGWDSLDEANTWTYTGISNSTWTLTEKPTLKGTKSFNTIDPESQYSMSIQYDYAQQNETATSPEIEVRENSQVEFWACFNGVWLTFADWTLSVNDKTAGTTTQLVSGFEWAQENAFAGPNWVHFNYDLSAFAGHTCTFSFNYKGQYGDDMSIDGFRLTQQDTSADAVIRIVEGESIHFADASQGNPTAWSWTFEGGEPATSEEQNPVVTYNQAGEYSVSLTVTRGEEQSTVTRQQYVIVTAEAPRAHIGLPEGAYLSPWAAAFVPTNVALTYRDLSEGNPTSWAWTFEGTDVETSEEQNPVVTYTESGLYGLELTVSNAAGSDRDFLVNAVQAGGALDVWNITPEESSDLAEVGLGWYGSYAGTNWLGMRTFAEHFDAPLAPATVDTLTVYFASVKSADADAQITVSLCKAAADGQPGEVLGSASLPVSSLAYDDEYVVPTQFILAEPIAVDGEFFVTIAGFPQGNSDDVAVLCAYRGDGARSTTWHELEDEDENYNPLGTYSWVQNTDEGISMALTAHLNYDQAVTNLSGLKSTAVATRSYDLQGRRNDRLQGIAIEGGMIKFQK